MTKSLQLLRAICRRLEIPDAELDRELIEMASTTSVDMLAAEVRAGLADETKVNRA